MLNQAINTALGVDNEASRLSLYQFQSRHAIAVRQAIWEASGHMTSAEITELATSVLREIEDDRP